MRVRITKYDPSLRNEFGAFVGEDWTSVSDIGKFPGLTIEKYLRVENGYLQTLRSILDFMNIRELRIGGVGFWDRQPVSDSLTDESWRFCRDLTLKELSICNLETAEKLVRAALREVIGFRAYDVGEIDFCVSFGYDFYMYFATDEKFDWVKVPGIFVEEVPEEEFE